MPTASSDRSDLQSQNTYILDIQSNTETKVYKLFLEKKRQIQSCTWAGRNSAAEAGIWLQTTSAENALGCCCTISWMWVCNTAIHWKMPTALARTQLAVWGNFPSIVVLWGVHIWYTVFSFGLPSTRMIPTSYSSSETVIYERLKRLSLFSCKEISLRETS